MTYLVIFNNLIIDPELSPFFVLIIETNDREWNYVELESNNSKKICPSNPIEMEKIQ